MGDGWETAQRRMGRGWRQLGDGSRRRFAKATTLGDPPSASRRPWMAFCSVEWAAVRASDQRAKSRFAFACCNCTRSMQYTSSTVLCVFLHHNAMQLRRFLHQRRSCYCSCLPLIAIDNTVYSIRA